MTDHTDSQPYRVLARKYRPSDFSSLIGQEAMVQTLSNAIAAGRLAHAFILTGVRGVGKTTTARIIARALNCVGPDGTGGPTADPCGVCEHCVSIAEDRHVDVIEMDAASRTGVDDIRELIDGVLYRPVSARYKIYIIDEVHMLSRNAFNALLKTLEEPPEHVKFIFATTEIRRVPVTVLSRCQRFDLRRVGFETLSAHFSAIAEKEGATVTDGAIALIARAADGSVRDGLSLLDQAVAHSGPETEVTEAVVRDMLGVAERVQVLDLFEKLMQGEIADALALFDSMYGAGADPVTILQDLAELTHWLTRLKAAPGATEKIPASDLDLSRGDDIAGRLGMPVLARTWQMLLKGLGEVRTAPSAAKAAEMVLVRIAYAAELPSPADLAVSLRDGGVPSAPAGTQENSSGASPTSSPISGPEDAGAPVPPAPAPAPGSEMPAPAPAPRGHASGALAVRAEAAPHPDPVQSDGEIGMPSTFEETVALFSAHGEPLLHAYLVSNVHLVRFEIGKIALRVTEDAPRDLAMRVSSCLSDWTGRAWFVEDSLEEGEPTLQAQRDAEAMRRREKALAHPTVQQALETFPGAEVTDVRTVADPGDGDDPIDPPAMETGDFDEDDTDEDFI